MALTNPITVKAVCVAMEHKLEGESSITLRFNSPDDQALQISNLGDFIFKTTSQTTVSQFIIGDMYTITLQ